MVQYPVRAGRREWIGLAVLALPTLLVTMDLSVLFLAVPKLTEDLRPTSSELLWITDIYGFLIAASLITMGSLGDRIGRRELAFHRSGQRHDIDAIARAGQCDSESRELAARRLHRRGDVLVLELRGSHH